MKNSFSKCMAFIAIGIGLSVSCFANQTLNQSVDSENYYLQPGGIFIAQNGIYASIDGTLIQINNLCADEGGVFVPFSEIAGRLVKCPFCQRWYDPDSKVPHKCRGTPD